MNHICALVILGIAFLSVTPLNAASVELLFEAGNRAYLDGNYDEALKNWHEIEMEGFQGGELFYNIGNAYYKLSEKGRAILYWEKAARIMSDDKDLTENLQIARVRLTDKIEEPLRLPVWEKLDVFRSRFSASSLAWGSSVFCSIFFVLLATKRWLVKKTGLKTLMLRFAWVVAIMFVIDASLLGLQIRDERSKVEGILLNPEAEILSAPADGTGKLLFSLHEGSKVRVLRRLEGWYEISAGKDKVGWVKSHMLGII